MSLILLSALKSPIKKAYNINMFGTQYQLKNWNLSFVHTFAHCQKLNGCVHNNEHTYLHPLHIERGPHVIKYSWVPTM